MSNIVTGVIAYLVAILFLGMLAFKISSVPLTIILLIGIVLMFLDFIQSMKKPEDLG